MKKLIYGKDETENIVGLHVKNDKMLIYTADGDKTNIKSVPFQPYFLLDRYDDYIDPDELKGRAPFGYIKTGSKEEVSDAESSCYYKLIKTWKSYNKEESTMLKDGYTLYNGMKLNDISVLSFDIETTGVTINENSFVVLISNTFRSRSGRITKRLFDFTDYDSPKDFIDDWCSWVRQCDPDVLCGHNVFGFDFPYLRNFAKLHKTKLVLGRDISPAKFSSKPRQFRKDGSQSYDYYNVEIAGRNVIDTFFLSIKYDVQRKYPSYGLKPIMKFEGLEKEDRQHWDFSKNKEPWNNVEDYAKFKQYAKDDADDALALFDLMVPQFFYYTQSIPMQFQNIINRASGSQVNMFMIRAYLQDGYSIPEPSEKEYFKGGISMGNPGVYNNVYKVDVASLYPSIMLQYKVQSKDKDPRGLFLKMVEYFTNQRLENKRLAAETGDRYYKDMSNGQKIMINSAYGFMGAPGLHFNYPDGAAAVTAKGREILTKAIEWATGEKYNG